MALSLRQQAFVDAYLKDPNGTTAAVAAGYSPKAAAQQSWSLLRNPKIQAALAEKTAKSAAVAVVDAAWVLQEAKATYQDAKSAGQYAAATKCLELIGRHLAMFTDNHRITVDPEQRESRLRAILGIADRN
jgi:phage terminase small subunit